MRKAVLALVLMSPLAAWAQQGAAARPQPERVSRADFTGEEDVIEGKLTDPEVGVIDTLRPAHHESLLKVRKEFRAKVLSSVGDL